MAYHPNVPLSDLPATETPAEAPAEPQQDLEPFAPISHVLFGPGDDTLTTIDETLAPAEIPATLVDVASDTPTETVVLDLSITDPTPATTDTILIPAENTTLVPTVTTLPLLDGTDYAD